MDRRRHVYFLLFAFIIFCIFQYGIQRIYGISIYPDEFGYWANAATIAGYDWTEVAALGSYYSYGYSMLLYPIFKLCPDGVMAYRTAVFCNVLLQTASVGILWKIYVSLFLDKRGGDNKVTTRNENSMVMMAGISVLYPVWTFYAQMTLTEGVLFFLYILACYLMILYLKTNRTITIIVLSVLFTYMYMVHMRTIGIVIAFLLTLLLMLWNHPKKYRIRVIAVLALLAAGIILTAYGRELVSASTYVKSEPQMLSANGYGGKWELIKRLLTGEGTITFLLGCGGKLYYLLMSSFGMLIPAAVYLVRQVRGFVLALKHKEKAAWQSCFAVFVSLSILGQFAVSAIFMSGDGRLDNLFYGRYNEYLVPLIIGLGMMEVLERDAFGKIYFGVGAAAGILFGFTFYALNRSKATVIQGDFAAGLNYITNDGNYAVKTEFPKSFLFGILLTGIFALCLYMTKKKGHAELIMAGILLMEIGLSLTLGRKYTYRYNEYNYANLKICGYLSREETADIYYLDEGGCQYIDLIQFNLRDRRIQVIDSKAFAEDGRTDLEACADAVENKTAGRGYLIIQRLSPYRDILEEEYDVVIEQGHFALMEIG